MNPLAKGGIAIGTIAGISGIGYGVFHNLNSSTYADLLKGILLGTNDKEDQDKWEKRLATLKKAKDNELINELKTIKAKKSTQKEATWNELRDWCKKNINNQSKGEKDIEFQNIQSYCTFSNKEKLTKSIDASAANDQWKKGHDKLQSISKDKLVPALHTIKEQASGNSANEAVKGWCSGIYDRPYKGEKDLEYKNASEICKNS
ncbi:hypothetical protein A6V39_05135 [Candidatus Mycoplasma haematobovis]|uniref:Uncharacterized protein n=1 Tax=Candidatus Mycoplasma haematobovis TaxID=432608 RepID=A0A1A9QB70_9MOLU|nr:hypothetical protein [Candidatus Mycoplasma haematobovis]OAL09812.1 hypothetical protein A6V39_05135 [Candidatus Mycoplasma haematobovis]